ncbi:MAG: hypothetical protein NUV75_11905 [Gallionella sp.]|nr:hypothetical protein [Gallionella sp.]
MQTSSSHKVTVITHGAWHIDDNGLFLVFADVAVSINIMRQADLKNCKLKIHYSCGLVECMKKDFCEFCINCADAGKYCGHPSIKYNETMNQALIEMSDPEKAMDSAAIM